MTDLAANLRVLCARYRSVSELCRELDFNRQQFNRYLSGETVPSAHNLRRIALHFDLAPEELRLDATLFRARHGGRVARDDTESRLGAVMKRAWPGDMRKLRPLRGFYHSHFISPNRRDTITRTFIQVYERDGAMYSRGVERAPLTSAEFGYISKYDGLVTHLNNCIFVIEYEMLTEDSITETVLYPPYRKRLDYLTGVTLGMTSQLRRRPFVSPIIWKYLGQAIDVRAALAACGRFTFGDRAVDQTVKRFLMNPDADAGIAGLMPMQK